MMVVGEMCRKRSHGPELDGPQHSHRLCQNVPRAAGAAAGAAAVSEAANPSVF